MNIVRIQSKVLGTAFTRALIRAKIKEVAKFFETRDLRVVINQNTPSLGYVILSNAIWIILLKPGCKSVQ